MFRGPSRFQDCFFFSFSCCSWGLEGSQLGKEMAGKGCNSSRQGSGCGQDSGWGSSTRTPREGSRCSQIQSVWSEKGDHSHLGQHYWSYLVSTLIPSWTCWVWAREAAIRQRAMMMNFIVMVDDPFGRLTSHLTWQTLYADFSGFPDNLKIRSCQVNFHMMHLLRLGGLPGNHNQWRWYSRNC